MKLPLTDDAAFFRKKCEREQRSEDDGGAGEDRVNARPHVKKCHHLGNLMDNIGQAGQEAEADSVHVDPGSARADAIEYKRGDGEAGHGVAVKILRPGIVIAIQVILKERWHRPDEDRGEDRGVAFRKAGSAAKIGPPQAGSRGIQLFHRSVVDFGALICSLTND